MDARGNDDAGHVDRFCRAGEKKKEDLAPWCYYHDDWYAWPDLNLELDAQEHTRYLRVWH